ncbi:hypothetical protein CMQ_212 [Grosmannia clavigera kw1407]|uniref:Uncharacterized protein n=1 Tax=Grosmannia clavigera (strain kw1407 / UAMH 11150) TaxID=655863 RepID=F0XRK2_GROCL|nr:uncharacterized protein CMQ_212 [Grosmannia clavigera kw1407]EFW99894.1 hypothetical protein CMQ_212 [Grosmannia clavigera kw1407]
MQDGVRIRIRRELQPTFGLHQPRPRPVWGTHVLFQELACFAIGAAHAAKQQCVTRPGRVRPPALCLSLSLVLVFPARTLIWESRQCRPLARASAIRRCNANR